MLPDDAYIVFPVQDAMCHESCRYDPGALSHGKLSRQSPGRCYVRCMSRADESRTRITSAEEEWDCNQWLQPIAARMPLGIALAENLYHPALAEQRTLLPDSTDN